MTNNFFEVLFPIEFKTKNGQIRGYVEDNDCMICTSHTHDKDGYARIKWREKNTGIHRVVYEFFH